MAGAMRENNLALLRLTGTIPVRVNENEFEALVIGPDGILLGSTLDASVTTAARVQGLICSRSLGWMNRSPRRSRESTIPIGCTGQWTPKTRSHRWCQSEMPQVKGYWERLS